MSITNKLVLEKRVFLISHPLVNRAFPVLSLLFLNG